MFGRSLPVRVLAADDDAITLKLISMALRKGRYKTTTAQNGYDALEEMRKHHYDVVITDIMMPGMEGIKLISEILKAKADARIVAISSDPDGEPDSLLALAKTAGAAATLQKPFQARRILEVVDQLAAQH